MTTYRINTTGQFSDYLWNKCYCVWRVKEIKVLRKRFYIITYKK